MTATKRIVILFLIFMVSLSPFLSPASVKAQDTPEQTTSDPLCAPGIYIIDPQDCLPLGPSEYLTRMASEGMNLPLISLPAHPIDESLGVVPFSYAVLGEGPTPAYATLEDAIAEKNPIRTIEAGRLRYVSYINYADTENGRFFQLHDDSWVRVSSRVSVPHSFPGGIEFVRTPGHSFGWILPMGPSVETKRTPGFEVQDYTGHTIEQYQIVQIYAVETVNNIEWYMVSPDEWVEQRMIGRVIPNPNPPEGVTDGRWIEVNLFEQTLAVYDQDRLVYATLIATGLEPFYTRPGLFPIHRKLESTVMMGAFEADRTDFYYLEDVPWTMYYDEARALHGAYWRTAFGFPQSHGCVNLAPADAHWLFNWAHEGDWVYVWDPSGQTPTDPSYYGEGGA
jgi:L,D-transpeptidase catalytic domain